MASPSKNAGDFVEVHRDTASLTSYNKRSHSRDRLNPNRHSASLGSGSLLDNSPALQLELNAEPLNPCGCCYLTKKEEAAKLWSYINLVMAVVHTCYKWWVTLMVSGGTVPYVKPYAMTYAFFCSKTKMALTGRGYCFDVVGQLFYLLGSIIFVVATGKFKEFKPHRKLLTRLYMGSIVVYGIGAYVPQTIFWFYDGHCIPPSGMSLCEVNNGAKVVVVPGPYNETKSCFPLTHTYFTIIYFSSTATLFTWWVYGFIVAHSHLYLLKKLKYRDDDATAPAALVENRTRGRMRRDRDRSNAKMQPSVENKDNLEKNKVEKVEEKLNKA